MGLNSNRLDFLRLAFAGMVFVYHAVVLSATQPESALEQHLATLAELSIQGFFIISGALVYGSFERARSLSDYAGKRIRRLYPAYVVVILIPALISAVLTLGEAGAGQAILRYLGANLIFLNFLEPSLPGLFEGHRFEVVNGALWTLKIEVMFYLVLPVIAWGLTRLRSAWWVGIVSLVMAGLIWRGALLALDYSASAQLARQLPGQMMYFAAGMALWRLLPLIRTQAGWLILIGSAALGAALLLPLLDVLRVLGLAALVAGIGFVRGPALNAARWGDISYGVYIVHFPIVQALVAFGVFETYGLLVGLTAATFLVVATSYLLWWWVERPALRRDSHYRTVSREGSRK